MLAYLRGPDGAMGETPQFCVPLFWAPEGFPEQENPNFCVAFQELCSN